MKLVLSAIVGFLISILATPAIGFLIAYAVWMDERKQDKE